MSCADYPKPASRLVCEWFARAKRQIPQLFGYTDGANLDDFLTEKALLICSSVIFPSPCAWRDRRPQTDEGLSLQ